MGRISTKLPSNPETDFRSRPIVGYYNDMIYLWVVSKLKIEPSDTKEEQEKNENGNSDSLNTKTNTNLIPLPPRNTLPSCALPIILCRISFISQI